MITPWHWIAKLVANLLILTACQSPSPPNPEAASKSRPTTNAETVHSPKEQSPSRIDQIGAFNTTSPTATGQINHPELGEISGLAASTRRKNTFWAVNDSGNKPALFALTHTGQSIGRFPVAVNNRDWEDLASAWIDGESYLLIADIGDNQRSKEKNSIYVFREPLLNNRVAKPLVPAHTLQFRYPDGAHNAESMAVADDWIYILTKEPQLKGKRQASQVYRMPLDLTNQSGVLVAEKIANLAIPAYSIESSLIASLSGLDISQPTAFDIDAQNRYAYVLTYRTVYRYKRELDESWAQALAKPRRRIHTHSLSQAEALAISANGVVWFTSEKRPAPLWALPGWR